MKRLSTLLLGALALTTAAAQTPRDNHPDELPFAMPEVTLPAIPEREATLTGFGGDPSGARLSTEAFAAVIDHLAAQGGGTLRIPAGVWHTGPIVLRSNIRLEVERGAIILFSNDKSLYPLVEPATSPSRARASSTATANIGVRSNARRSTKAPGAASPHAADATSARPTGSRANRRCGAMRWPT